MSIKKWVLGISYGHHESSACALSNSGDVIYLREEWLSRVKNDYRYPLLSIDKLKKLIEGSFELIIHFQKPLRNWVLSGLDGVYSKDNYLAKINQFKNGDIFIKKELKKNFNKLPKVAFCPHHLSHCLAALPFAVDKNINQSQALHVVLDGYGDGVSGGIFLQKGNDIEQIKEFEAKNSLGLVYSAITEWSKFKPNEDEFKVMALSAYGNNCFLDQIENEIIVFDSTNGSLSINSEYFNFSDLGESTLKDKFFEVFGEYDPSKFGKRYAHQDNALCNVISSFQVAIENSVRKIIDFYYLDSIDVGNIFLSGGLFHNSVLVGSLEDGNMEWSKKIVVPPSPGDSGSSLGAAIFGVIQEFNVGLDFLHKLSADANIGPELEDLEDMPHLFKQVKTDALTFVEKLLDSGEPFGTFNGNCEMGPRALGARSLICDAENKEAIEKLNVAVKQREPFRPIAVMISEANAKKYFSGSFTYSPSSSWMGKVTKMKKNMPFSHADNSTRPQVVSKDDNLSKTQSIIYRLLIEGRVLGNTSFNIAGDPMVFTLEDLFINCVRMNLKYIVSGEKVYEVLNENFN